MIAFVIVFIAWQIGRWLVLPHLQIFPYIPPNPLWEGLYSIILAVSSQIFAFVILLVLFLWVLFLVIDEFIRYIFPPFSMIIVEIILAMTPFRELKESGLFDLFSKIFRQIIPSGSKISQRIKEVAMALGEYLVKSLGFTKEIVTEISEPLVSKMRRRAATIRDNAIGTVTDTISGVKTSLVDGTKNITDAIIKSDPLPENQQKRTKDDEKTPREELYLNRKYEQCLIERNKPYDENMSGFEKAKVAVSNSLNNTLCSAEKIKAKLELVKYKNTK